MPSLAPELQEKALRLRDDFPFFARNCLKIRDKDGGIVPLKLNRGQLYLHEKLEAQRRSGKPVRAIVVKGRQMGCCYAPHMRVLTADYRWIAIDDVRPGQRLVAVDENGVGESVLGRSKHRKMRTAIVEAVVEHQRDTFAVELDNGITLEVTGEHRHLCRQRGGVLPQWRAVADTKVGDFLRMAVHAPDDRPISFEDGWASGVLDGEGSYGATPEIRLCMTQVDGPVLDRFKRYLNDLGVNFYEQIDTREVGASSKLGSKPVHKVRIDCFPDIIKVLTRTQPTRFAGRELFVGRKLSKSTDRFNAWAKVVSIKPLGKQRVIDLQTSEKTFVCEGVVSHNSTYLQARFYWRLWRSPRTIALNAFILTHEQAATDNLFGMAQRFHDYIPEPIKPPTKSANAKELKFADNGCGYSVATAGSREVGRSATVQLLHGSEVPSWPNAEEHVTSLLATALARGPGTEAILEATAKGIGNVFHRMCMAAVRGESEYEAIFIPWFWDEGYVEPCPEAWASGAPPKWVEYATLHGLDWEQLYWAFLKNRQLAQAASLPIDEPCPMFRQEFPATFDEAFQSSGNSFIPALSVLKARQKRDGPDKIIGRGPIILGIDPARSADNVGIIDRCGRVAGERISERWPPDGDTTYLAQRIAAVIQRLKPDAVNIDIGGNGAALYDILLNQGFGGILNAVNFGSNPVGRGPTGDEMYTNRRAEMYDLLRDWFETPGGVQIPDDDSLHTDLTAAIWGPGATRYNPSTNELIIEPKDKIKERLGASPDLADALALTFAVPFFDGMTAQNQPVRQRRGNARTGY